ncbi:AMP-binding protein [Patulibacter sp. NPDC049589]|uniref:acyl-CoA synthetase n=1 Tax=Patulibacter sp. NPDC049589 TaxID=3154731 RepID=UPI00342F7D19
MVNFARDTVDAADPDATALIELARDGSRRVWSFGEVADGAARLGGLLAARGVGRGDVVMTLIGNRPEWVLTMVACFRIGAVVLPCTEQLRAADLRSRLDALPGGVRLIVADDRNRDVLAEAAPDADVVWIQDPDLLQADPAPAVDLEPADGCLITFTSGTSGRAKPVLHGQRYLTGQAVQAEHWLGAGPDDLVWCTAASGWSKSARNVFIAPWLRGAAALLHDARFDPAERLELLVRERVTVLCMAPTEYRVIGARAIVPELPDCRGLVAAGEALNPEVIRAWREATGLTIRDGYGQTETGQITGVPPGGEVRPGSMGRPLPGVRAWIDAGELVVDPATVPTFFLGYLGADDGPADGTPAPGAAPSAHGAAPSAASAVPSAHGAAPSAASAVPPAAGAAPPAASAVPSADGAAAADAAPPTPDSIPPADRAASGEVWRTGDRVTQDDDGYLFFEGRTDDVIISAGYRIGPFEVESALVSHPAVAEAAAVAAPAPERGSVVRAVVVLRDGHAPSDALARELQDHVKAQTAPYKYPRIVEFVDELPKTSSGKVRRKDLREGRSQGSQAGAGATPGGRGAAGRSASAAGSAPRGPRDDDGSQAGTGTTSDGASR